MNYFGLYIPSFIMIIACSLLVRQCFKPYFIDPSKVVKQDFMLQHYKEVNLIGKIMTAIAIIISLYYFIIPVVRDTLCILNNEYVYEVVETSTSFDGITNSAKHGEVHVFLHPEFMYDSELDKI